MNIHEDLSRKVTAGSSSDRSFGLVFAIVFLVVGFWPLRIGGPVRIWSLCVSVALFALALLSPSALRVPNRWWTRLGMLLARVVNPVVTGVLYYLVITPMSIVLRLLRKDPLRLRFDPAASSYWIERTPPGPPAETMSNQF